MMTPKSTIWAAAAQKQIKDLTTNSKSLFKYSANQYTFRLHLLQDTLWIVASWKNQDQIAFRTAFSPDGLVIDKLTERQDGASIALTSSLGKYHVTINFYNTPQTVLNYKVSFKASQSLSIPFWPKDILITGNKRGTLPQGDIYVKQLGIRSGLIFAGFKQPAKGSFLYFQNLTSINDYCTLTETSVKDTVSGEWPEIGFSLPPATDKPFPHDKEVVISDAFICFGEEAPKDQFEISTRFLDQLAAIYQLLPRPETKMQQYPEIIQNSIHDLETNKGCWSQHKGCSYLNPYVCDYKSPPEIMVQLAVLLPVWDYTDWSGDEYPFANQIYDNIKTFYNEELKTIKRWLPAAEDQLDGSEEQKLPNVMDAWYLHHPLLNLGRMALTGDKMARELFLNSVDYAIKVAHHFNYKWPVFYDMNTLAVLKQETQPGRGGEKDVAGVYAQVMLQAFDLTGDKRFFKEAEKAARSLMQYGFDVFYQANNTAFSTKAMLRLYQDTKNEIYLKLCYLLVANLFKNMAIWECNYGYGKNFPLFFGLFPLNDAPYLAVYEEQESFSAMHDLLNMAEGTEFLASARLLLAEYIKYMINRAVYYYPPMLQKEMLSEEVKTGEIDPKLWIALEDIHDGWEKAGIVGQEVYGAGLCFGIVPRHYIRIPNQPFMIYIEYPTGKKVIKDNTAVISVLGSNKLTCRIAIIETSSGEMPCVTITLGNGDKMPQPANSKLKRSAIEYEIKGDQQITISW